MMKSLSAGLIFFAFLSPCIGLAVLDDKERYHPLGTEEETSLAGRGVPAHAGAASVQQRHQSRQEYLKFQKNVREHAAATGGAFVGHVPDHVLEHLATEL
jgi:hypothetical protein